MGTRAIYIFEDENEEVWAYKHYDNYPRGAANFIEEAKAYAWPFPRFEADEFAAAFVAANKNLISRITETCGLRFGRCVTLGIGF